MNHNKCTGNRNRSLFILGYSNSTVQKSYHPYFSDDLKHDTTFVETVIEKILDDAEIGLDSILIIQRDNC